MRVDEFDFALPEELIAQHPAARRDESRLLVLHKKDGSMEHRIFREVIDYLNPGDCLVLNDTRVIPARLIGEKKGTGGKMEFVLLKRLSDTRWETLVKPGKRAKTGSEFIFGGGVLSAKVLADTAAGGRVVEFSFDGVFEEILDRLGQMPLPPYISARLEDPERYQTVYARERGSAAAPTAGLHFTPELLSTLEGKGVRLAFLTLHVGLGTFRPVKAEQVEEHQMHAEFYSVPAKTAEIINQAKATGGRIITVGTTSTRTLETVAGADGTVCPGKGWTDIFIYPGYRFKVVDGLITNFHLPKSTLIMLVSALAGRENVLNAYAEAVRQRYRFYSFGDAMLII